MGLQSKKTIFDGTVSQLHSSSPAAAGFYKFGDISAVGLS